MHLDLSRSNSRQNEQLELEDGQPAAKRMHFFDPFENPNQAALFSATEITAVYGDEYEIWQQLREPEDAMVRDPVPYWLARQLRFPRLSRMALDFLTIPPMSAECERVFSATGKMVDPLRFSLDVQSIGSCQTLRSWYRTGLLNEQSVDRTLLQPEGIEQNREGDPESSDENWVV